MISQWNKKALFLIFLSFFTLLGGREREWAREKVQTHKNQLKFFCSGRLYFSSADCQLVWNSFFLFTFIDINFLCEKFIKAWRWWLGLTRERLTTRFEGVEIEELLSLLTVFSFYIVPALKCFRTFSHNIRTWSLKKTTKQFNYVYLKLKPKKLNSNRLIEKNSRSLWFFLTL